MPYGFPEGDMIGIKVKAFEVRTVAMSLSFKRNLALNRVFQATTWKSSLVFPFCYSIELTFSFYDIHPLRPLVATCAAISRDTRGLVSSRLPQ